MEEKSIELEILLETKDYWRTYLDYYFNFSNVFYMFLGFAVFGLFVSFLLLGAAVEIFDFMGIFAAAILFVLLFAFVMTYFSVQNAKILDDGKCKYIFSNEKVEMTNKSFGSRIDWTYFYNVKETKKYFVLSMKNGQSSFISKRCFRDDKQIEDFKELVRAKLGAAAVLNNSKEKLRLR